MAVTTGADAGMLPLTSVRVLLDPAHLEIFSLDRGRDSEIHAEHQGWQVQESSLYLSCIYHILMYFICFFQDGETPLDIARRLQFSNIESMLRKTS